MLIIVECLYNGSNVSILWTCVHISFCCVLFKQRINLLDVTISRSNFSSSTFSDQYMDLHVVLVLLFISSLLVCHNDVEGGTGLSEEEYLELEKQIEVLNKPAVKTIHVSSK